MSDGDTVACRFISSAVCVFPEISNQISFEVNSLLSPDVDVVISYQGNDTYQFTAIPTNGGANPHYQWYKNGTPIAGATQSTYIVSGLAVYEKIYVQMVSSEPCVQPSLLKVISRVVTTGLDNINSPDELNVYPNPNTGTFTVSLPKHIKGGEVTFRDMSGKVIKQDRFLPNAKL